jgi:hypothetical protein
MPTRVTLIFKPCNLFAMRLVYSISNLKMDSNITASISGIGRKWCKQVKPHFCTKFFVNILRTFKGCCHLSLAGCSVAT